MTESLRLGRLRASGDGSARPVCRHDRHRRQRLKLSQPTGRSKGRWGTLRINMPRRDSDTGLRCCSPCFVQSNTNYVLRSTLFPGPWVVQDNSYVSWMRAVSRRAFSWRHIASGRRCWRLLWWVAARAPCGVGGPIVVAGELLRRSLATHSRCSVTPPKTSIPRQRRSKAQHQQRSLASSRPLLAQFSATSAPSTAAAAPLAGCPEFRLLE